MPATQAQFSAPLYKKIVSDRGTEYCTAIRDLKSEFDRMASRLSDASKSIVTKEIKLSEKLCKSPSEFGGNSGNLVDGNEKFIVDHVALSDALTSANRAASEMRSGTSLVLTALKQDLDEAFSLFAFKIDTQIKGELSANPNGMKALLDLESWSRSLNEWHRGH